MAISWPGTCMRSRTRQASPDAMKAPGTVKFVAATLVTALAIPALTCAQPALAPPPAAAEATAAGGPAQSSVLKVCADAHNMPQSNDKGEGYENKIAEALARDFKRKIEYTYFPQRMGFVRNTLRAVD